MARDYTEAELADLTDAEREALLDDSEDSGPRPSPSNVDGDVHEEIEPLEFDDENDDEVNAAAVDTPKEEEGKNAGDDTGADDAAAAEAAGAVDDENKSEPVELVPAPILEAEAPADVAARLDEIKTKKEELAEQFDNGDLTGREYQSQLDALNKDERAIEQSIFKAQLAAEISETQARNAWIATTKSFLDAHPEYTSSPSLYSALNHFVKEIAKDEANNAMTGHEILAEAHRIVKEELGGGVAKTPAPADKKPAAEDKRSEIPTTLAKLPAAEIDDTSGNRFAALDRLADSDPLAYEAQLARMSPADRDAYLAQ